MLASDDFAAIRAAQRALRGDVSRETSDGEAAFNESVEAYYGPLLALIKDVVDRHRVSRVMLDKLNFTA